MKSFPRADRVAAQIHKVLSEVLAKKIKDPRLDPTVITGVKMSRDIKTAIVYYTVSGDKKVKASAAKGFQEARGYIKRTLAGRLGLRYMPEIKFYYDESIEYGAHIDNLIRSIHSEDGNGTGTFPAEEE
jgi:ribosome-binding factor A